MMKTNMDTMSAIFQLSRTTKKNIKSFSFAGTKDKRGITTQRVCAFAQNPADTESQLRSIPNLRVGNFSEKKEALQLGDLQGNRFCLAIRDLHAEDVTAIDNIHKNIDLVAKEGFINYYGMQRFGTHSVATHEVGKSIVKKDWAQAVRLILGEYEAGSKAQGAARVAKSKLLDCVDKGEYDEALKTLEYKQKIERAVIVGMQLAAPNGYFNGIANIPRSSRMIYVHAYQSYVWNRVVSCRLRKFGRAVCISGKLNSG